MKRLTTMVFAAVLMLPAAAGAQPPSASSAAPETQGVFPDLSFDAGFRKFTPPRNDFSPFYSWDAHVGFDLTLLRKGRHSADFVSVFQTVGTENLGSRISVGGTGYILGFSYTRAFSDRLGGASAGIQHLSTHLTRDLDEKDREQRAAGNAIPHSDDPTEYNVVFARIARTFPAVRFSPRIAVTVDPINFTLDGGPGGYVRPLYVTTRWTFWRGADAALAFETEHEIGHNPYNNFTLRLEMARRGQAEGRVALVAGFAPGDSLHVSPNIGGRRDGLALGFSIRFKE